MTGLTNPQTPRMNELAQATYTRMRANAIAFTPSAVAVNASRAIMELDTDHTQFDAEIPYYGLARLAPADSELLIWFELVARLINMHFGPQDEPSSTSSSQADATT